VGKAIIALARVANSKLFIVFTDFEGYYFSKIKCFTKSAIPIKIPNIGRLMSNTSDWGDAHLMRISVIYPKPLRIIIMPLTFAVRSILSKNGVGNVEKLNTKA